MIPFSNRHLRARTPAQDAASSRPRRPRALFIVSRYGADPRAAGGDVQGATYARWLASDGWQVVYLTSRYQGAPASDRDGQVRILRLPRLALAWAAPLIHRIAGPWDMVYGELLGGAGPLMIPPLYRPTPVLLAWYQVNAPLLKAQLGDMLGAYAARLEQIAARLCRGAFVLTPSEARRRDLIALGLSPQQVFVVPPCGVSLCSQPLDDEERPPLFVWLGKLRRYKAPHVAVQAMELVLRYRPDARLIIAGRAEDRRLEKSMRAAACRYRAGAVAIMTDIDDSTKHHLLHHARALLVTSPVEGFSIAALEAARCGTPVIATWGVPDDMVIHRHSGLKIPYGNPHALAEAMLCLASPSPLWKELSAGSLAQAALYTEDAVRRRLAMVVETALNPGGRL